MSYILWEHQKHILFDLLTQHDRFLLLPEQGTGKTLPVVLHLSNLMLGGEVSDALIVSTAAGLAAWRRDIAKLSPERQRQFRDNVTLINYDKLSRTRRQGKKKLPGKWQELCDHNWDFMVLDECHALKKQDANRTRYFVGQGEKLGLTARAKHLYLLTGTLITNSKLEDLWSPLRAIHGSEWMSWKDFKRHYLVTKQLPGSYVELVIGYRNRQELLDIVGGVSYRVLKKDCLDLPPVQPDELIYVPFPNGTNASPFNKSSKALYDDALDSYVEALDMVMDNPLTRLLRMRQIAAGHIKETDTVDARGRRVRGETYPLRTSKIRYALELIEANLPRKTVVFYQWTASCKALEKALQKAGIAYHTLNGEQKDKDIWLVFQKDDTPVFIAQYESGARSIDLYASSYTIYLEPTDSSEVMEQSRARTDRGGQTTSCEYVFLLTEGTVEVDMYKRLAKHEDFSEEAYREIARGRRKG